MNFCDKIDTFLIEISKIIVSFQIKSKINDKALSWIVFDGYFNLKSKCEVYTVDLDLHKKISPIVVCQNTTFEENCHPFFTALKTGYLDRNPHFLLYSIYFVGQSIQQAWWPNFEWILKTRDFGYEVELSWRLFISCRTLFFFYLLTYK